MTSVISRRILSHRCGSLFWPSCRRKIHQNLSSEEENYEDILEEKGSHIPVLLKEVVQHLALKSGSMFLDMTFGAGGHTEALLKKTPNLLVFALDRDPTALGYVKKLQKQYPDQVVPLEGKFSDLATLLTDFKVPQNSFDGVLMDLGCSSMHFDEAERGFSIVRNGPLDMRMDGGKNDTLTAADVIAYATERELAQIFKVYGGEQKAMKVARAIVQARGRFKPLKTTHELNDLIETVLSDETRTDKLCRRTKVATKVFKGLRTFVNNEINELNQGLLLAHIFLKPAGRAAVISFDSSEDQIVKRHFQNCSVDNVDKHVPLLYANSFRDFSENEFKDFQEIKWKVINKKVIIPSNGEVRLNARSRSAKLRVAEKCSDSQFATASEFFDENM